MTTSITLSHSAIEHFAALTANTGSAGVRLLLLGGGCAGFKYKWSMLNSTADLLHDDLVHNYGGWLFVTDPYTESLLKDSYVDFISDITGSSLTIKSPNTSSSCGCGESVSF